MKPTAVETTFDVAFWFADTALNHNEYLQPQKMQRLLFLAQAYFAVLYKGRKLMPAFFIADEAGPIEPTIYKAFQRGRPDVDSVYFLDPDAEEFLTNLWRKFGHHSADHLTRITKATSAYREAYRSGPKSEITFEAMRQAFTRAETTPAAAQVAKPKVMRTQEGKPVVVKAWAPKPLTPKRRGS